MKSIVYLGCPAAERAALEEALAAATVAVVFADDAARALNELERRDMPVVLDLSRDDDALLQAHALKRQRGSTVMFAVVDPRRADLTLEAIAAGVADVFTSPLAGPRLLTAIEREERLAAERHADTFPAVRAEELYAYSRAMQDVREMVTRSAATRAGLVICGEPGTGRTVVARNVHAARAASTAAFVTLDCAGDDPERMEQQLFGHVSRPQEGNGERRALERVTHDSQLVAANGGTLYFRNVADMPARLQARLVRLLRDREAIIAGVGQPVGIDIRPISAVESDLDSAVRDGRLREDLARRLAAVEIRVPPLRGRREDIPALANRFLREFCFTSRVPAKTLSRPALSLLAALPWRGNAAELRAVIEAMVRTVPNQPVVALDDVLLHIRLQLGDVTTAPAGTLRQARARFEREYIGRVLDLHRGRVNEAAKTLGIQRTNLYRKMRALHVVSRKIHDGS